MFHILHHHNGIIHHDTDSENQSQQSQDIQREAENQHEAESTDQGYGHRDNGNQSGTPALQREEHHQYHKNQRLEQCFIYLVNRLRNISSHIKRYLVAHSFGEIRADFFHSLLHVVRHFHGIGSRKHIDAENGCVFAIDTAFRTVRRGFERYARHIAETDDRPVGIGTDHNILKLFSGTQTALRRNRNGDVEALHRLLSQYAGSRLTVLVLQCVLQVLHGQTEVRQLVRHSPNLHGIVTASDIGHTAHTGNTTQEVEHVDGSKITQIDFIELRVTGSQADGH